MKNSGGTLKYSVNLNIRVVFYNNPDVGTYDFSTDIVRIVLDLQTEQHFAIESYFYNAEKGKRPTYLILRGS